MQQDIVRKQNSGKWLSFWQGPLNKKSRRNLSKRVSSFDIILLFLQSAMRESCPPYSSHVSFSRQVKHFLSTYKVQMCQINQAHLTSFCHEHHSYQDRRRNPYKDFGFLYYPKENCSCLQEDCSKYHNSFEYYYHPLVYKTQRCPVQYCQMGLFCYYGHDSQAQHLFKYQFFRFQLQTFKTKICKYRQLPPNVHELSSCRFYHQESDKRRNLKKIAYSHVECEIKNCKNENCLSARNKIEQLYHPARYKTKYCQSFFTGRECSYHEFCSFAHSNEELMIQILDILPQNEHFWSYKYKTVWCPLTHQHDRGICKYAHNFQDFRRDPKIYNYSSQQCPKWIKGEIKSIEAAGCPQKMNCKKSHGWNEHRFHPQVRNLLVKTQSLQLQSEKKQTEKNNPQHSTTFGVGAPFFKQEQRIKHKVQKEASQSKDKDESCEGAQPSNVRKNNKSKDESEKGFNFSILIQIPQEDTCSIQEKEVVITKDELKYFWDRISEKNKESSIKDNKIKKNKRLKKTKVQYTKSLQQLLTAKGIYEKLTSYQINQIKLLSLSNQDLQKLGFSNQEKELFICAKNEYWTTHKLDKLKYTDSFTKLFKKRKIWPMTIDKLKIKGVSQSYLQALNKSGIQELSFLQEDQKNQLSQIVNDYKEETEFKQLNLQIQQSSHINSEQKPENFENSNFKT